MFLEVSNLYKKFNNLTVLDNINFCVPKGSFVCILGPSGCGKTTLLRIISGLDTQTSGNIFLDHVDLSNLIPAKRKFGMVFQSYALFPNLTVKENVSYGINNHWYSGSSDSDQQTNNLLSLVDLLHCKDMYPSEISGGMQQRVALARALAISPKLLLLDEPLSALDTTIRISLRKELRKIHNKLGITTIMVTHDQEEAMNLADYIIVMSHGKIEQAGTPEDLYKNPANDFVANFVGPTNVLTADLVNNNYKWNNIVIPSLKQNLTTSTQAKLFVRPEDVKMLDSESQAGTEYFDCVVQKIKFQGSWYKIYLVVLDTGDEIFSYLFESQLKLLDITEGKLLNVGISVDKIKIFLDHDR
jgi:iron(III) transport system ATP-binding protein